MRWILGICGIFMRLRLVLSNSRCEVDLESIPVEVVEGKAVVEGNQAKGPTEGSSTAAAAAATWEELEFDAPSLAWRSGRLRVSGRCILGALSVFVPAQVIFEIAVIPPLLNQVLFSVIVEQLHPSLYPHPLSKDCPHRNTSDISLSHQNEHNPRHSWNRRNIVYFRRCMSFCYILPFSQIEDHIYCIFGPLLQTLLPPRSVWMIDSVPF